MPAHRRTLILDREKELTSEQFYFLEAKGYQLISARSLTEAIETIFSDPPELVIIIQEIKESELEVLRTFKNGIYCAHIPFIAAVSQKYLSSVINWDDLPVDDFLVKPFGHEELAHRMSLCLTRMHRVFDNNPLTRLPGNTSILKAIQSSLDSREGSAIGYVDIDNFKPYNDRYGFSRGDEILRMVAMLLTNSLRELQKPAFIGHVGGDDYVFILPISAAGRACQKIVKDFDAVVRNFIDKEDLAAGFFLSKDRNGKEQRFPFLSLSIAVICNENGRYQHYGAVAQAASQIKKYLKTLPGSNFLIERRKGAGRKSETSDK